MGIKPWIVDDDDFDDDDDDDVLVISLFVILSTFALPVGVAVDCFSFGMTSLDLLTFSFDINDCDVDGLLLIVAPSICNDDASSPLLGDDA
jgi:hypothetical protein